MTWNLDGGKYDDPYSRNVLIADVRLSRLTSTSKAAIKKTSSPDLRSNNSNPRKNQVANEKIQFRHLSSIARNRISSFKEREREGQRGKGKGKQKEEKIRGRKERILSRVFVTDRGHAWLARRGNSRWRLKKEACSPERGERAGVSRGRPPRPLRRPRRPRRRGVAARVGAAAGASARPRAPENRSFGVYPGTEKARVSARREIRSRGWKTAREINECAIEITRGIAEAPASRGRWWFYSSITLNFCCLLRTCESAVWWINRNGRKFPDIVLFLLKKKKMIK